MTAANTLQFANLLSPSPVTLPAGIAASGVATFSVSSAVNLPAKGPFKIAIQDSVNSAPEYILISDINGVVLTVGTRGIGGSAGATHAAGAIVQHIELAEDAAASFPSGDAVAVPATATWDPTLATVNVTSSSGGGDFSLDPTAIVPFKDYTLKDVAKSFGLNPVNLKATGASIEGLPGGYLLNTNGTSIVVYSDKINLWIKSVFLGA